MHDGRTVLDPSGVLRFVEIGGRGGGSGDGRRGDLHAARICGRELAVRGGLHGDLGHEPFDADLHVGCLPGLRDGLHRRAGHGESSASHGLGRHLVEGAVVARGFAFRATSQFGQVSHICRVAGVGYDVELVQLARFGVRYGDGGRLSGDLRGGEPALQDRTVASVEDEQREGAYLLFPAFGRRCRAEEGAGHRGRLVRQGDLHYAALRGIRDLVGVFGTRGQHGQSGRSRQKHLFHKIGINRFYAACRGG